MTPGGQEATAELLGPAGWPWRLSGSVLVLTSEEASLRGSKGPLGAADRARLHSETSKATGQLGAAAAGLGLRRPCLLFILCRTVSIQQEITAGGGGPPGLSAASWLLPASLTQSWRGRSSEDTGQGSPESWEDVGRGQRALNKGETGLCSEVGQVKG